jgi:hypothetical protein
MPVNTREVAVVKIIDLLTVLISKLGPWVLAAAVSYYIRGSILAAMRQETLLPAWMKMMASVNQVRVFGFIFGLLGLAYGLKERELRRRAPWESAEHRKAQTARQAKATPVQEECTR